MAFAGIGWAFRLNLEQLNEGVLTSTGGVRMNILRQSVACAVYGLAGLLAIFAAMPQDESVRFIGFVGFGTASFMAIVSVGAFLLNRSDARIRQDSCH